MRGIDRNIMAQRVSEKEGRKVQINIAQIKEVQKCVLQFLSEHSDEEIISLIRKVRRENK